MNMRFLTKIHAIPSPGLHRQTQHRNVHGRTHRQSRPRQRTKRARSLPTLLIIPTLLRHEHQQPNEEPYLHSQPPWRHEDPIEEYGDFAAATTTRKAVVHGQHFRLEDPQ